MRILILAFGVLALVGAFPVSSAVAASAPSAAGSGTLEVRFIYLPPGETHPTYHTAIWLEDASGKLVKTLFVSQELSSTEYKLKTACPSWVGQVNWADENKTVIDAVTGPTPLMGGETLTFDLAEQGIAPGAYRFRFEVHFVDAYNTSFTGTLNVGADPMSVDLKKQYLPAQPDAPDVVRDVRVQYYPKK